MNTRSKTFPVTKSYLPDRKRFDAYVDEIYSSNWLTNFGALHERLEQRLQKFLGVENLLLISNGTLALQVAYRALGFKGEVITTPFSFVATTSSLIWENLTPVFADIDPSTLTMDVNEIEKKITGKTSGILPVHIYGNVCDVDAIAELAKKHKLKVVYDAAHAFSVNYRGQSVLNYGDASILSFHATKLFHTIEGGAIRFKDRMAYERARKLINFGITGPDKVESLGINCKMNEFQAAMGLAVLDEMEEILAGRKRVFEFYLRELPSELIAPFERRGSGNWSYFPLLLKSKATTLALRDALEKEGVLTRRYFYPVLNTLDYLETKPAMPIAEDVADRILCIPLYPQLKNEEMAAIAQAITKHLRNL